MDFANDEMPAHLPHGKSIAAVCHNLQYDEFTELKVGAAELWSPDNKFRVDVICQWGLRNGTAGPQWHLVSVQTVRNKIIVETPNAGR